MSDDPVQMRQQPPPLRIHHLLIWMTASAVVISGSMWFERTMKNGPRIENPIIIASLVLGVIAITGAIMFTLLGIAWSDRVYPFPKTPGEFLLSIVAQTSIGIGAAFLGVFIAFAISHDILSFYFIAAGLALLIYWFWVNGRGMSRFADSNAWRFVFALLAATATASLIFQTALPMIAFLLCLLWAAFGDVRRGVARGWIHWLGVSLAFAVACALIGIFDVSRFVR